MKIFSATHVVPEIESMNCSLCATFFNISLLLSKLAVMKVEKYGGTYLVVLEGGGDHPSFASDFPSLLLLAMAYQTET